MAQASRRLRRLRRVKREKSLAYRALGQVMRERNAWKELAETIAKKASEAQKEPSYTIKTIEENPVDSVDTRQIEEVDGNV